MGILLALTVFCAVFVRCGSLDGGETLEDIAKRQEAASSSPENEDTDIPETAVSDNTLSAKEAASPSQESASLPEGGSDVITDGNPQTASSSESPQDPSENESDASQPAQEEQPMEDRNTYQEGFYYESLSDTVKARITGISYPADDSSAAISYDTIRYVCVQYYDFNGESQSGELICHKAIAQDLVEIFYALYEARYPIEKICLVEEYQGDDESSMQDNNTSCFNYRALPSGRLSNHAYGLAIDLNPFYNPYVVPRKDGTVRISPAGSEAYADREQDFAYKIDREDLAYRLFIEHGFTWGGSWRSSKDYQHFEKAI